ncbi:MAG: MurR/RpiR family transcriptional regulator [Clostridiales bacterium]|nr:MurR/RpiR family transcriptional regulator [Clostridiales bacterium]
MDIIDIISEKYPGMSKGHKAIADYCLANYDRLAYITAAGLGELCGVSESTVVRFPQELGFAGYPEFQKAVREEHKSNLTSVQRLSYTDRFETPADAAREVMKADIANVKNSLEELDMESFDKAVNCILNSRKIYIMGIRASAPLSEFMHFYMTLLFDDVVLVRSTCTNELFEQVMSITDNDVLIGISFPRYSSRTINSMEFAKKKGASIIAITDKDDTPMTKYADIKLFARSSMASFADSLTAPLSLINALLVALGMNRKDHIKDSLESLETMWAQYKVYELGNDRKDTDDN